MDTLLNPFYATSLLLYPWKNKKIGGKKKAWNGLIQNNNLWNNKIIYNNKILGKFIYDGVSGVNL